MIARSRAVSTGASSSPHSAMRAGGTFACRRVRMATISASGR